MQEKIVERLLKRLSLADEVSKFGTIVDNPGNDEWPYKAECHFHWELVGLLGRVDSVDRDVSVLLSKSKNIYLISSEDYISGGDVMDFLTVFGCRELFHRHIGAYLNNRQAAAERIAIVRGFNVWED